MQQRGFTLIELIIVIVILGILAVTAAPRFIDLSSDANASVLRGVQAAVQSGAQLVYARSAIEGQQANAAAGNSTSQVSVGGQTVETDFGYPDAEAATAATIGGWVQIDLVNDFFLTVGTAAATTPPLGSFGIAQGTEATDYSDATQECYVIYTEATDADSSPTVTVTDTAC
ncbi:prepilin-type N-terminal cleavage/methylation domain-containing protein [Aliiglaciecola sp. M165]|uniref:prepilin-type N-terminal cleavage/methylation domain-containing protein n=1 Tax=Aliiglaciecola sp. M165 TaxID=2593649 RepID=UPI00117F6710|nr:prepilin-type N-terminal cleavage/methylation domain-containing protein [Aliiglaciecola sp. M165]TRY33907.1 prepilin-type N-terminal cleavage/methylation domain-containing protein [Aliiglaciecola sp. M165]